MEQEHDQPESQCHTLFRQYDAVLGRWWSIDPEQERYASFSPYTAMGANPVNFVDPDGRAVFYTNDGAELYNDGVDDGLKFLSSADILASATESDGSISEFTMRDKSFLLPDATAWKSIGKDIIGRIGIANKHENAGAYALTADNKIIYKYGGESITEGTRENSAYAIKKALTQLLGSGATLYMTYIHSHPDPSHGYAQTPTNPEDYDAVSGFGIHSGTMTTKSYIFFYKGEESSEIGISKDNLENIIKK